MHRIGGLEKQDVTGNVSYDPANHEHMVHLRAEKVRRVAHDLPPTKIVGPDRGELLVLGWGCTYGSCHTAVAHVRDRGGSVAHVHLRHLSPLPPDLPEIMARYKKVLIPELNMGQLRFLIRAHYLVDAIGLNKVQGRPFSVAEIVETIQEHLGSN
jgi:2-oxoglutarate ferredoxin oxidoreductase subunit alpha